VDLTLPAASLSGWLWGVHLRCGVMACELDSVELRYDTEERVNARGGCAGLGNAECVLSGKDAAAVRRQCTWTLGYR
jgi:hypothetical protein